MTFCTSIPKGNRELLKMFGKWFFSQTFSFTLLNNTMLRKCVCENNSENILIHHIFILMAAAAEPEEVDGEAEDGRGDGGGGGGDGGEGERGGWTER